MNPTRETKTITTPKGIAVELYTYLTGRERRDMQGVFLKDVELANITGDTPEFKGFKASALTEAQDYLLKTIIVSVGGSSADCLNAVLNMEADEYEYVLAEVNKVTGDMDKKKQS